MAIETRQLMEACWRSAVFGDSYTSSVSYVDFVDRVRRAEQAFVHTFKPIIVKGAPELPPEDHEAFMHALSLHVIGLFSNVGVEIHDIDRLTSAYVCFGLLFWGETYLDRGDLAMEAALVRLLEEQDVLPTLMTLTSRSEENPKLFPSLPDVRPSVVQTRLDALRMIEPQIMRLSRPDDILALHLSLLEGLKYSLGVRLLNYSYQQSTGSEFWETQADLYVKHSILSMSLFGYVGLIYSLYRLENSDLPSLAEIQKDSSLLRFISLANAAARVFDDAGDQKLDAGEKRPHIRLVAPNGLSRDSENLCLEEEERVERARFQINIFNNHDQRLIRAFFSYIGEAEESVIAQALEEFQKETSASDLVIIQLFIDFLRRGLKALPEETLQRYSLFITLAKRCIETACNNSMGDEAFGL